MDPLYARYPFLSEARAAVEAAEVNVLDVVTADRSPIVDRGIDRVKSAIHEGQVSDPIPDPRTELLSYPVARVLVSMIDDPVLTERYALAEARRAFAYLSEELEDGPPLRSDSGPRITRDQLLTDFDLQAAIEERESGLVIEVTAYLSLTEDLRERTWRLVSRHLTDGYVRISRTERDELLREAIRRRVGADLPLDVPEPIATALEEDVESLDRELSDITVPTTIDTVDPTAFPPCIQTLRETAIEDLTSLSTNERFYLVTFLCSIGADTDTVATLLEVDETDRERIAYQVTHLHGDTRSTAYPPPSCETLSAMGICDESAECVATGHPLLAYRRALAEGG